MGQELDTEPKARRLGNLGMVWHYAAHYPGHIACAGTALVIASSATIAIPYGFKRVIDRGFRAAATRRRSATPLLIC